MLTDVGKEDVMKSILVDGVEYAPVHTGDLKIVVLDRGFVVVGNVSMEGDYVIVSCCSCVRRWGTKKGLGELAMSGPLENTVLDPQPTTRVHQLQVIQMIDCDGDAWKR